MIASFVCALFVFVSVPQEPVVVPDVLEGAKLMQEKDFAGATEVFRARVKADENDAQSWRQLGLALHSQGKWEEALAAHTRATGFPRTAKTGAYNAACACSRLERLDDAFGWLQKAVAAGWGDRALLASDVDLENLRKDKRFATVLPPLLEGSNLFVEEPEVLYTLVGEGAGDQFGWVARVVGDLDADGVQDFAATAPSHNGWSGAVYVHSGKSGKLLFRMDGEPGWQLGNSVEGRVDVNRDGTPDVIAGAPGFGNQPGRVVVASGKDGAVLQTLTNGVGGDQFGMKVAGLPDIDRDGFPEILAGAPGEGNGRVYIYSGRTGEMMTRLEGEKEGDQFGSSLDATRKGRRSILVVGAMKAGPKGTGRAYLYEFTGLIANRIGMIQSDEKGSNLGQYFAAFLGDVNGDGVSDAYLSDWNHGNKGPSTGRVYVLSGENGFQLLTIDGRKAGEGFGTSQAVCGDVNRDGIADLCVGAWQNSDAAPSAGKIYVVSGKDGSDLATFTSKQAGDTLGFDAVGLGDVNGDGGVDFLVTAAWSTVQFGRQGRVFVLAGPVPAKPPAGDAAEETTETPTDSKQE